MLLKQGCEILFRKKVESRGFCRSNTLYQQIRIHSILLTIFCTGVCLPKKFFNFMLQMLSGLLFTLTLPHLNKNGCLLVVWPSTVSPGWAAGVWDNFVT